MENHIQLHLAWLYIFHKHTKKNPIGHLQCSKIDIAKLLLRRFLLQLLHRKSILRLKLIWLNSHHDRFCRSRREACCFQQNSRIASGHHVSSLPQRALHADENGRRWKLEPVILQASFERQKKINQRKRIFFTRSKLKCILPNFKIPSKTPHFTQQKMRCPSET